MKNSEISKIYNEDNGAEIEINNVNNECCLATMSRMPDYFIDLVITSPPY